MATKSDGPLPPGEDPFLYNQRHGAFVEAWSTPGHGMTWSLLEGVAVGLWNALYLREKYRVADFTIWVGGTDMVGVGNLCADNQWAFLLNRTAMLTGNVI